MKRWSHKRATIVLGLAAAVSGGTLSGGTALAAWPESAPGATMSGAPAPRGHEASESALASMRFRRRIFDLRPAPERPPAEPTEVQEDAPASEATIAPAPAGSVTEIIYAAAAEYGLDGAYLVSVAECESGLDPGAVNAAGYYGLFQFDEQTWAAYGSGSIFDPSAQARAAAMLIADGQASRWPNCA